VWVQWDPSHREILTHLPLLAYFEVWKSEEMFPH
jgi:hypothetical protein